MQSVASGDSRTSSYEWNNPRANWEPEHYNAIWLSVIISPALTCAALPYLPLHVLL